MEREKRKKCIYTSILKKEEMRGCVDRRRDMDGERQ